MVNLGDLVKDRISGVKGIVVCKTYWLFGCVRITIQPQKLKDGFPVDSYCFDEAQADVVKEAVENGPGRFTSGVSSSPAGGRDDSVATSRS